MSTKITENLNGVEPLFEFANAPKAITGLPVIIWIQAKIDVQHQLPRIKFQNSYSNKVEPNNLIPLSISDDPQVLVNTKLNINNDDLNKIKQWVKNNKTLLLQYWNY